MDVIRIHRIGIAGKFIITQQQSSPSARLYSGNDRQTVSGGRFSRHRKPRFPRKTRRARWARRPHDGRIARRAFDRPVWVRAWTEPPEARRPLLAPNLTGTPTKCQARTPPVIRQALVVLRAGCACVKRNVPLTGCACVKRNVPLTHAAHGYRQKEFSRWDVYPGQTSHIAYPILAIR